MGRKSKQDWLETGLKVLSETGVSGLTIERMTVELGVTKGSFYHHFESMGDFERQLINHWADQYLSTAASLPESTSELLPLLDSIMEEAFGPVTEPELAIRVWAHQDEMVQPYVEQVDAARRAFVLHVFRSVAETDEQARLMADMLSTMLIGSTTILPPVPPERVLELYREFKRLYGLGGQTENTHHKHYDGKTRGI